MLQPATGPEHAAPGASLHRVRGARSGSPGMIGTRGRQPRPASRGSSSVAVPPRGRSGRSGPRLDLAKLRLKPTRRLERLGLRESQVPRPRRSIEPTLTGTASPDRSIHRISPLTLDPSPTLAGGEGRPLPGLPRPKTRLVRHDSGLIRHLAKLRLKPTRRLKRLRRHGPLVPHPRRAITAALLGTATPEHWIHRMPPATPRSPSHPTGGKGTPPPSRAVSRGARLVRHDSGLIRHLVTRQPSSDRVPGEDFSSLARRSDAGVAGPTSRRSNAASGGKDRQDTSLDG